MVKLAVYKGKGMIGNYIIRWWKKTQYSHCELVISPRDTAKNSIGYSASLMDGGVRAKVIDFTDDKWDFVELPWADADKIVKHYQRTKDNSYGIIDLFWGQFFNRPSNKGGDFCSEWCAAALGLPNPHIHDPASLLLLCKHLGRFYAKQKSATQENQQA